MQRAGKAETEDTGAPGHTAEQTAESHTGELRGRERRGDRSLGDEAGTHKKPAHTWLLLWVSRMGKYGCAD